MSDKKIFPDGDIEQVLFSEEQLASAVKQLGQKITDDYQGRRPLLVGILKGSVVFMTDLMRAIKLDCDIDFMTVSSYGNGAVSAGKVDILKDIDTDIAGRDVILIEDILESARTLDCVVRILRERGPASVKICALLDKKCKRAADVEADYKCFDIEDRFVVGYGLDYAQAYRCLPYVGVLKREVYEK